MKTLRKYLIAGILVWAPLGAALFFLKFMVDLFDQSILLLPASLRPEQLLGFEIPGLGVILSLLVLLLTGLVISNVVGRWVLSEGESILERVPFVRTIYKAVKQILTNVLGEGGQAFRKVCLIEYPRMGAWTLCFQTGVAPAAAQSLAEGELVTLFVPTTPNPTSGFVIFLPRGSAIELDMKVEDALQIIMSLGATVPATEAAALASSTGNP